VDVGLLDAFAVGASTHAPAGSRGLRFHVEQPLHLAPEDAYPAVAATPENFFAGALRWGSRGGSFVGLQGTLASPVAPRCTESDARLGSPPAQCTAVGGAAAATPFALRWAGADWAAVGQVAASRAAAGRPARLLPDGTVLRPGDVGWGGYVTLGKVAGEPIRATLSYEIATPQLDLNAVGYQPDQNEQTLRPQLRFVRKAGVGAFHEVSFGVAAELQRSTDGRRLDLGRSIRVDAFATLPGYQEVSCSGEYDARRQDLREIVEASIAYERPAGFDAGCSFATDRHRAFSIEASGRMVGVIAARPLPATLGWRAHALTYLRPHPRSETSLDLEAEDARIPGRFVEQDGTSLLFGDLAARTLSATVRQQFVFTPRLTLQGDLQLFLAEERFGPYRAAAADAGGSVSFSALANAGAPADLPDFTEASLRATAVLRWEYRLGSTLYLVYIRDSDDRLAPGAPGLRGDLLGRGPSSDTVLLKASLFFSR
jgi:hypothetical protein